MKKKVRKKKKMSVKKTDPMKPKIKILGAVRTVDLRRELSIDLENPAEQMAEQALRVGYYAEALVIAKANLRAQIRKLEQLESKAWGKIEEDLESRNTRVTNDRIKAKMRLMPAWRRQQEVIHEHTTTVDQLEALLKAFWDRREMLVSINVLTSAELKSSLAATTERARAAIDK